MAYHLISTPHPSLLPHKHELEFWGFHWVPHHSYHFLSKMPYYRMFDMWTFSLEWVCLNNLWNFNLLLCVTVIMSLIMYTSLFHFPSVFYFFNSSLFQTFGGFLGQWSFDTLWRLITYKQVFFPLIFGGIRFILTSTITPIIYL